MKRDNMPWEKKGLASWVDDQTAYISVVFTWRLMEARHLAEDYLKNGFHVRLGGNALFIKSLKKLVSDIAEIGGEVDALVHHNPFATMASRGCPINCSFCIVPRADGTTFKLLPDFVPKPILCDSNVSALPVEYQEYIIEKYKKFGVKLLDINSGFEPRTFDEDTFHRWKAINRGMWRWAYDETNEGEYASRMAKILKEVSEGNKRVYVLVGNEPFEMCLQRVNEVISWKCDPFVQPVIALNALEKKPIVKYDWTEQKLKDFARWANRWVWRKVPFSEYRGRKTD